MQDEKERKARGEAWNVLETIQIPQSSQESAEELQGRIPTVLFLLCHMSHTVGLDVLCT